MLRYSVSNCQIKALMVVNLHETLQKKKKKMKFSIKDFLIFCAVKSFIHLSFVEGAS